MGANHSLQHRHPNTMNKEKEEILLEFFQYISEKVQLLKISTIAEEFSLEACHISNCESSVIQEIATQLGIKHLFCDPDSQERNRLEINGDDQKRELYWRDLLMENTNQDENIIFIVGLSHIANFCRILEKTEDLSCSILPEKWGEYFYQG